MGVQEQQDEQELESLHKALNCHSNTKPKNPTLLGTSLFCWLLEKAMQGLSGHLDAFLCAAGFCCKFSKSSGQR